jgi:hypothetical protein
MTLAGHREAMKREPPPRLFSDQCVEGKFLELRAPHYLVTVTVTLGRR